MMVLAIETTCDETSVAVVESYGNGARVLSNIVASSALMQAKYGGIVPEVAAREQVLAMVPVLTEALEETSVTKDEIEKIVVASEPGLIGSLLVGIETAKVLSWAWGKPLEMVDHMRGHLMANWIVENEHDEVPVFPAVGLTISGGHTDFWLLNDMSSWKFAGGTRDDACGEAFDKVARILSLPYPGGPSIQKAIEKLSGDEKMNPLWKLPRPMVHEESLEMSFSGLKAAVAKVVEKRKNEMKDEELSDAEKGLLAKEFSEAVVDVLVTKSKRAIKMYLPKSFCLAGGVAANLMIREALKNLCAEYGVKFFMPEIKYCGDNGAMIGVVGVLK